MSNSVTRIHILPAHLANQIAAGEVIERPASIVKELLENSLDAGAHEIHITLQQGGIDLIHIQDNGHGVHPDDMLLTISQHATSKIKTPDDLARIMTLGFRGEALASISAVSQLTLISAQANSAHAWQLSAQGREYIASAQPAAHPVGTSVMVKDLFYNTPARRKFLRSARTEWQYAEEVIQRVLLSRFDVAFSIEHNGKKIAQYPALAAEDAHLRIAKIFSPAFIAAAHVIDAQSSLLHLSGFVAPVDFTRSSHDWQYFYVNGRMVKDKLIQHALRQAFGESLHPGRYAAYVLYLTLDPEAVDVNVHPTKHEVRFQHTRLVHDFIVSSLQAVLHDPISVTPRTHAYAKHVPEVIVQKNMPVRKLGKFLTLLNQQLLISETAAGLGVVDLHAYYAYQALQILQSTQIRRQPLLNPQYFKVSKLQDTQLKMHKEDLSALGFVIDELGESAFLLREIPAIFVHADIPALMDLLLQALTQKTSTLQHWIQQLACGAIPAAGLALSTTEVESILDNIEHIPANAVCPHGLKVWQIWSLEEMRQ